jgi:prepilin peptidase CpaA
VCVAVRGGVQRRRPSSVVTLRLTDTLRLIEDVLVVVLAIATIYTDVRWRRIPNYMTFPAIVAGLVLGALEGVPGTLFGGGFLDHFGGVLLAFGLTYPMYVLRLGLGSGDAKFWIALGALHGATFFVTAALYGSIVGGLLAIVLIVLKRVDPPETEQAGRLRHMMKSRIPYGVALAIGALGAVARGG